MHCIYSPLFCEWILGNGWCFDSTTQVRRPQGLYCVKLGSLVFFSGTWRNKGACKSDLLTIRRGGLCVGFIQQKNTVKVIERILLPCFVVGTRVLDACYFVRIEVLGRGMFPLMQLIPLPRNLMLSLRSPSHLDRLLDASGLSNDRAQISDSPDWKSNMTHMIFPWMIPLMSTQIDIVTPNVFSLLWNHR